MGQEVLKWMEALPKISAVVNIAAVAAGSAVMLAGRGDMEEAVLMLRLGQQLLTGVGTVAAVADVTLLASIPDITRGFLPEGLQKLDRPARILSLGFAVMALALNTAMP